ncbi:MAG: hypothetical protein IPK65_12880 [Gammaproteobacteria bacterium]|nr:hypothetical protein [Gammaproteobacteria bacterium]
MDFTDPRLGARQGVAELDADLHQLRAEPPAAGLGDLLGVTGFLQIRQVA